MSETIKWACNCCRTCSYLKSLGFCEKLQKGVDYFNVCSEYKAKIITK